MPTIWFIILYFLIKSNYWKKFFLYLGFIFLLITSLPIVSTLIGNFFYSNSYKISNYHKKPAYILVPGAGTYKDVNGKKFPTPESIKRTQYGKELSEKFSIPLIFAGKVYDFLSSKYFANIAGQSYVTETKSSTTFEMAITLKKIINISDGPLLLATNPIHHKRTILVLEKQNFDVLIPDNYMENIKTSYSIIPSVHAISLFNDIIYETLGITWY